MSRSLRLCAFLVVLLYVGLSGVSAAITVSLSASVDIPQSDLSYVCVDLIQHVASIASFTKENQIIPEVSLGPWHYRNPQLKLREGQSCTLGPASDSQAVITTTIPMQMVADEAVFGLFSTDYKGEQQMGVMDIVMDCTLSSTGSGEPQTVAELTINHHCTVSQENVDQFILKIPVLDGIATDKVKQKIQEAVDKINAKTPTSSPFGTQLTQATHDYSALQPIVEATRVSVAVQTVEAGGEKVLRLAFSGKSDVPAQAIAEEVKDTATKKVEHEGL